MYPIWHTNRSRVGHINHSFKAISLKSQRGYGHGIHVRLFPLRRHLPSPVKACPRLRFRVVLPQRYVDPLLLLRIDGVGDVRWEGVAKSDQYASVHAQVDTLTQASRRW